MNNTVRFINWMSRAGDYCYADTIERTGCLKEHWDGLEASLTSASL